MKRRSRWEKPSGLVRAHRVRQGSDDGRIEVLVEASLSEPRGTVGNLLRLNLPAITVKRSLPLPSSHPSPSPPPSSIPSSPIAYTLWDCGGSYKFVHPDFVSRLQASGTAIKTRSQGYMSLTTAGRCERLPLCEARLTLDIRGYRYTGWFVIYDTSWPSTTLSSAKAGWGKCATMPTCTRASFG